MSLTLCGVCCISIIIPGFSLFFLFFLCVSNLCYLYSLVKIHCGVFGLLLYVPSVL